MNHWVCLLLLMVNVLNMLWARWLNMPLLMTRFPTIQCQLLGNSLKHLFNITWLKKSSMLTFLAFVMQAFGSCEIYNFMWSFSHCVLQARAENNVCMLIEIPICWNKNWQTNEMFSSKVVMFGKCLLLNL